MRVARSVWYVAFVLVTCFLGVYITRTLTIAGSSGTLAQLQPIPNLPPLATPVIEDPFRHSTLVGSPSETAYHLRMAHIQELARLAQDITAGRGMLGSYHRDRGHHLLLAHEAAATYLAPPFPYTPETAAPEALIESEVHAALDTVLAFAPQRIATYPESGELASVYSLAVSPDGAIIATGDSDGNVRLWDYEGGFLLRVLPTSASGVKQIQFSSDGLMLAATDDDGQSHMWYVESGIKSMTHFAQSGFIYSAVWRPNTYDLAVAGASVPVMIHPRNQNAYPLLDAYGEALAYSPDGSQLAIALQPRQLTPEERAERQSYLPEQRPIWIVDADTGEVLAELADDQRTEYLTYTLDGTKLIAVSGYRMRAWDIASATLLYESELTDFPNGITLTLDGTQIAILSRRFGITYYDLESGARVNHLPVDANVLSWLLFHPVDNQLISGQINGPPVLLDPATGYIDYRFGPLTAQLVATSPGSRFFVTVDNSIIWVHDFAGQLPPRLLRDANAPITDVAISPDGQLLVSRESNGDLLLWDLLHLELLWSVPLANELRGKVAFAADGRIVMGGYNGVLSVVDPGNGTLLEQLRVDNTITALAVSSQNEIAFVTDRPEARGWRAKLDNLAAGATPLPIVDDLVWVYGTIAYSPDGALLAVPRRSGYGSNVTLEIWETATSTRLHAIPLGSSDHVSGLAFTPNGELLATEASDSRPITLWDVTTGSEYQTFGQAGSTRATERMAFSPDGTELLVSGLFGITTRYSLTPTHTLRAIETHRGSVWDLDLSPNGHWVATAGADGRVRVRDWQRGTLSFQVIEEPERVYSVDFSPSGDAILTGGHEGIVRLYSSSGKLEQEFQAHTSWIVDAIFSPDGNSFATAGQEGSVIAWNRRRGVERWRVEGLRQGVGAIAYSPDGGLLAGSADGGPAATIYLWDAYTGEEVMQLHGHNHYIVSLAFSPDGTLLASASWDHTVKLWEVATGSEIATLEGHSDILTDLAFSPDGTLLASIAEDCTLRLWDVAEQRAVTTIQMPCSLPWAVAFNASGSALLTTHADGTLRSWLVDPTSSSLEAKMLATGARLPRATVEFNAEERRTYGIDNHVGVYPLSASGNVNLRPEPYLISLIIPPRAAGESAETLIALTNENFLLTSTDRGEQWRIVARLPLTLTYHSLGIPTRPDDPLLVATEQGLYQVSDSGNLTLIHSEPLMGVSYSHTNANELWAMRRDGIYKSEDRGASWGAASANLPIYGVYPPLLNTPPNNNPQLIAGLPLDRPVPTIWRGAANGFWEQLTALPRVPYRAVDFGIAWDAGNRILYLSGAEGNLLLSDNVDNPIITNVTASVSEHFGIGTMPVPLAVGEGPSLYVTLITSYGPRTLRGEWDGSGWHWVQLRLPLVAAG